MTRAGGVGVGTYRMTDRDAGHRAALALAVDRGCRVVDTAPHYGGGRAEPLVGAVLAGSGRAPLVVTKAGYVPDALAAELGLDPATLPRLDDATGYSLEPRVLRRSLSRSRAALGMERLDAVCLHNPEHLADVDGGRWTRERCEEAVAAAFEELEAQVRDGALRCYGVSSSTLSTGPPQDQVERLHRLVGLAASAGGRAHHLRIVQFPWNLLEHPPGRAPLLQAIRDLGLESIAHRALNATWEGRQVRLADRRGAVGPDDADDGALERAVALVAERLASIDAGYSPWDFAVMQFLRDQGDAVDHPDLVDLVFERQVRPFVARLFGDSGGQGAAGRAAFAALHRRMRARASERLAGEGARLRAELVAAGRIDDGDDRPLAVIAAAYPLRAGADHVVVGMRDVRYVDEFTPLMKEQPDARDPAARERTPGRAVHLQLPAGASQAR